MVPRAIRRSLFAIAATVAAALPYAARADNVPGFAVIPSVLPAVSGFNGGLDVFGGAIAGQGFLGITGRATLPVGHRFGLQFEGTLGENDGTFAGFLGHFFWRDPNWAMFGAFAGYTRVSRIDGPFYGIPTLGDAGIGRFGVEGALYAGIFSIDALIGYRGGDLGSKFFSAADIAVYINPDLKIALGHRFDTYGHAVALGAEMQVPIKGYGVSVFGEGRIGERGNNGIWAGVRFRFGAPQKSLQAREREDGIKSPLPDTLFAIGR